MKFGAIPCCCAGDCGDCSGTGTPSELSVTISGVSTATGCDGSLGGECCSIINDTYTLPHFDSCRWWIFGGSDDFGECGNFSTELVADLIVVSGDYILEVAIDLACSGTSDGFVVVYSTNLGTSKPDCSAWFNMPLSHSSTDYDGGGCGSLTSLTVEVTAV